MTGFILAGGKSSRFGRDKAFARIEGKPIIEILVSKLSGFFEEVFIIAGNMEKLGYLKVDIISDIFPDKGPLGGIYTGLIKSSYPYGFVVACDMPFIDMNVIKNMANKIEDYDIVVPKIKDRLHPLCAIYSKRCIPIIENNIKNSNLKVQNIFNELKTKFIDIGSDPGSFTNINTEKDYEQIDR